MAQLTITKLKPGIGAEVSGIDLSQPIDADTSEALSQALAEHLALVFHDQTLTPEQYLAAAGAFGPVMRQHYSQHHMEGFSNIGMVYHRNGQRRGASAGIPTTPTTKSRPLALILYGVEIRRPAAPPASPTCAPPMTRSPPTNSSASTKMRTVNTLDEQRLLTLARRIARNSAPRSSTR